MSPMSAVPHVFYTLYNIWTVIVGILVVSYSTNVFDDTFLRTFFIFFDAVDDEDDPSTSKKNKKFYDVLVHNDETTRIMDAFIKSGKLVCTYFHVFILCFVLI